MSTRRRSARARRHLRVRKRSIGTAERPRLAVYRSNRQIYAQVIDDSAGETLAAASSLSGADGPDPKAKARSVGLQLAERAKKAGVKRATFDRGGFQYHGRVQAVAEGAREGGIEF